jgi:hypothetical protein
MGIRLGNLGQRCLVVLETSSPPMEREGDKGHRRHPSLTDHLVVEISLPLAQSALGYLVVLGTLLVILKHEVLVLQAVVGAAVLRVVVEVPSKLHQLSGLEVMSILEHVAALHFHQNSLYSHPSILLLKTV